MCQGVESDTAITRKPIAEIALPATSGTLEPQRRSITPASGPITTIPTVAGTRNSPAVSTESANPYPVEVACSANCGITEKPANRPTPSRKATALVRHTAGIRIVSMSISGSAVLVSTAVQTTSTASPAASSPSVRTEAQPHACASLIASSSASRPAVSSAAPNQSTLPPGRDGDSGTYSTVAISVGTISTSGNQNSQW